MKALIQRVSQASVVINKELYAQIDDGFLVLLGIDFKDTIEDAQWICHKIVALRIFSDENRLMNRSISEIGGHILLVSQFTLIASYKKGNRPSFINAARPEQAIQLYQNCIDLLSSLLCKPIKTGLFGMDMQISLVNDGPVTILLDTNHKE
jgi:D-tyrosyl-tRNA(Tyr) deacylase